MNISLSAFVPEILVSQDGFGSPVLHQPAHLYTEAESGAYLRDSSRVPRRRPFIYFKPSYAIGSVPSLSGHAIAYRWRSLPRVRWNRASKPQGSSERVLPWQVTMDPLIYVLLSHMHEVGMFKVPAMSPPDFHDWVTGRIFKLHKLKTYQSGAFSYPRKDFAQAFQLTLRILIINIRDIFTFRQCCDRRSATRTTTLEVAQPTSTLTNNHPFITSRRVALKMGVDTD